MLKEIWKSIFCFIIVLSSFSASATCLKEGDKVSLTGVVSEKLYYGPPSWGEDKANDEKLHEWILHLKQPLTCVTDADTDNQNWNQDVQLIMRDSNDYKVNKHLLGKSVSIDGVIFLAETGYHMTPVLLDDAKFEVAGK
ncbi:hypothetical protein BV921_12065 [Pectobacterium odoriferum]|uniref:DUF4431 domain-containing protein n=1 Tax=Pectobacterium odoriferum TaxID=78398 RepID=UPI00052A7172|nr:DUF4431 domain-containing protein [Pectobacterium odoriferum]GKX45191.1 hypothetical protein SOASR015_42250 [Pectobacterium carotovorum subsp. carotovorum]AIU89178.1 hypothetical protein BCS7_14570 [Pectobacterium odoriferum]POD89269.1 hypothetical protein BV925_22980 [Pectobacterium odoriferum]POD99399.1 hypothetical protein BV916_22200 [Pectobacterium odoriferum]POE09280.1 hypothetical protein BV921_12065 [Pectobacterium odoriferum]